MICDGAGPVVSAGAVTTADAANVVNAVEAGTADVAASDAKPVEPTGNAPAIVTVPAKDTVNGQGHPAGEVAIKDAVSAKDVVNKREDAVNTSGALTATVLSEVKAGVPADTKPVDAPTVDEDNEAAQAASYEEAGDGVRTRHRGRERQPDRDYIQFFRDLNITDSTKVPFLAGLLRNFRDAASKLHAHLAVYSTSVHAAVSRMTTSPSPYESPQHLWIRVHDRLGFFHDEDGHAQRLVNIGLAYAYRHLEMDALAIANAKVLKDMSRETGIVVSDVLCEDAGRVDGGTGVAFNAGSAATQGVPAADRGVGGTLPVDGASLLAREDGRTPGFCVNPCTKTQLPRAAGGGDGVDSGDGSSDSGGEGNAEVPPPADEIGTDAGDVPAGGDKESRRGDDGLKVAVHRPVAGSMTRLVFARQPVLKPTAEALAAVVRALAALRGHEDAEDACRELFINSVLLCIGNRESSSNGSTPYTSERCWTELNQLTSAWWPYWESTSGRSKPVPGTAAFKRSSGRLAAASRWCFQVEIDGVHETLKTLSAPGARCPQQTLPATEVVERLNVKDKLKLTALVAAMLLLASKEKDYAVALVELIASGVGQPTKGLPLSSAKCQSFTTTGLVSPATDSAPPARGVALPAAARADARGKPLLPGAGVPSSFSNVAEPGPAMYAEVKSAGVKAAARASKEVRAIRRGHIKERRTARGRAPVAAPPVEGPSRQGVVIDLSTLGLHAEQPPVPSSSLLRPPTTGTVHPLPVKPAPIAPAAQPIAFPAALGHLGRPGLPPPPPPRRRGLPPQSHEAPHLAVTSGAKRARTDGEVHHAMSRADVPQHQPGSATMPPSPLAVGGFRAAPVAQPPGLTPSWDSPGVGNEPPGMPFFSPPQSQSFAERRLEREQQHYRVEASSAVTQQTLSQLLAVRYPHGTADGSPSPSQQAFGRS